MKYTRYVFRRCGATFTVYHHNKNVTHVTGVKSKSHLKQCEVYIKKTFNIGITQVIIDNQFYSHKDNKVLDMVKIFNKIREMDEYSVIFEPELFIAMSIKHIDRKFPTCLLYPTGSYTFLGGKMEFLNVMYKFITYLINKYTKS